MLNKLLQLYWTDQQGMSDQEQRNDLCVRAGNVPHVVYRVRQVPPAVAHWHVAHHALHDQEYYQNHHEYIFSIRGYSEIRWRG